MHAADWAALGSKVVAHVQAHPLPYILLVILFAGIVLGRYSAN